MNEETLFHLALEQTAAERAAFLERACAGDAALRRRVEVLLGAHANPGTFLGKPLLDLAEAVGPGPGGFDAPPVPPVVEGPGDQVGPYRLVRPLGEGGMGIVFLAEQTAPVRRQVALKVIRPGLDSDQVAARFEAERQALALMDHPHIARVLDGGATETGRPYFVMELVPGVPLTAYCDEHRLTVRERLELFVPVCRAVQHAHQKGVIHRDLKPSNVLVTLCDGKPVPKVIDFGVAKAAGPSLTEKTLVTGFGTVVGTLEYMAPEQAQLDQLDVDTRSDVYSLGVLLYELLTGTPPLPRERLKAVPLLEALRLIREEEPPRPSARLAVGPGAAEVAAKRGLRPERLRGFVRGELDWVALKCLEKGPDRRYQTAGELARDIERYLTDEPVRACPPSAAYRLRKFARRHRRGLAAVALLGLVVLAGVGGAAGSIGWAARGDKARRAALGQQLTRALADADDAYRRGGLAEVEAAVERAEGLVAGGAAEPPGRPVAQWRDDLAMAARLEEVRLAETIIKDGHFDTAAADPAYRDAFRQYGLDVEALDPEAAAARVRQSVIRDRLVAALDDWVLCRGAGEPAGTDRLLAVARRADPDPWRDRLRDNFVRRDGAALEALGRDPGVPAQPPATALLLASMLVRMGQEPVAVEMLGQVQHKHPADFWVNHALASALLRVQPVRTADAVAFYRVALALRPDSAGARLSLGSALQMANRLAEAEAEFREAVRLRPDLALARDRLGNLLLSRGRPGEAEAEFRAALGAQPGHPDAHAGLLHALLTQGKADEAEAEYRDAVRLRPDDAGARAALGLFLLGRNRADEAEGELREAARLAPDWAAMHYALGEVHARRGQWDRAAAAYGRAVAAGVHDQSYWGYYALTALGAGDTAAYRRCCTALLQGYGRTEDVEMANIVAWVCVLSPDSPADPKVCVRLAEKAHAIQPKRHAFLNTLGAALYRAGDYAAARQRLEEAMAAYGHGGYAGDWAFLALCHYRLGHAAEARQWLDRARRWLDDVEQQQAGKNAPWSWQRRLELRLLTAEADRLLRAAAPGPGSRGAGRPGRRGSR